ALALNRAFWLAVAAFLVVLTVRIFPRREHDAGRALDRLQPKALLRTAWRLSPVLVPAIVLGVVLGVEVSNGTQGGAAERREEEYRGRNLITWGEAETPWITRVDLDLELDPETSGFKVSGTYDLRNHSEKPMQRFPMSVGDHFEDIEWTLNGEPHTPEDWARIHVFALDPPLPVGESVTVGFSHSGRFPRGINKNGGGMGQFILPSGTVLTGFSSSFLPLPFFESGRGVNEDNALEPRDYEEGHWHGLTPPGIGAGSRYAVTTRVTLPESYRANGVGVLESDTVRDGRRTMLWRSDHPVNFFNVVAGRWDVWEGDGVQIFHHPEHTYNLEEMGEALIGSRKYYSEWFYEYPWQELKLSEFPGLASYAQGFPTNITFSENLGFLTRSQPEAQVAFMVTAHEAAHQWWGNILMPGRGPGGNVIAEGMAHFSTVLLFQQLKGDEGRIGFLKQIEELYGDRRQVDSEKPLVWIDGSKAGDTTATYDKGGWVFWMLLQHLGRDNGLAGIRDFIHRYAQSDDYPLLQDFIEVMREHAVDVEAYDAFVQQWFFEVVVPTYRFSEPSVTQEAGRWIVEAQLENTGTGRMPVEVAAVRGERFPADDSDNDPEAQWSESRVEVILGAGESTTVRIECVFEPEQLMVDPDAHLLMLRREKAVAEL
ncbi:MAG: M1 family aminopeptidase, partial [Acidobacteriota bacterium]